MGKINLTEKHKGVLQKHLEGKYTPFFAPEEEQKIFNEVIDMANDLMDELNAYETVGDDLMSWFWEQYQAQEDK